MFFIADLVVRNNSERALSDSFRVAGTFLNPLFWVEFGENICYLMRIKLVLELKSKKNCTILRLKYLFLISTITITTEMIFYLAAMR